MRAFIFLFVKNEMRTRCVHFATLFNISPLQSAKLCYNIVQVVITSKLILSLNMLFLWASPFSNDFYPHFTYKSDGCTWFFHLSKRKSKMRRRERAREQDSVKKTARESALDNTVKMRFHILFGIIFNFYYGIMILYVASKAKVYSIRYAAQVQ